MAIVFRSLPFSLSNSFRLHLKFSHALETMEVRLTLRVRESSANQDDSQVEFRKSIQKPLCLFAVFSKASVFGDF